MSEFKKNLEEKNEDVTKKVFLVMHKDEIIDEDRTEFAAKQTIQWKDAALREILRIKPMMKHIVVKYSEVE